MEVQIKLPIVVYLFLWIIVIFFSGSRRYEIIHLRYDVLNENLSLSFQNQSLLLSNEG